MATLIKQTEGLVNTYPSFPMPKGCSISKEALWQRIEPYVAVRFGERTVEWVVEGPGEWHPPLKPATISTVEVWSRAGEYETVEPALTASPLGGYFLPCTGPYRFTGVVGDTSIIPDSIKLALFRLGQYMGAKPSDPGVTSESVNIGGDLQKSTRRDPAWMAMALQNSGAADLLRQWRTA